MAPCLRILSRLAWLIAGCSVSLAAGAASTCDPLVQLPQSQLLSLKREAQTLSPVLKATLTRELRVRATRATFGLAAAERQTKLAQDALLPRQVLGLGKFDPHAVVWEIGGTDARPADGELVLAQQGRRFLARVANGRPQAAGVGGDLLLAPDTMADEAASVGRGATVTALSDDEFEIASGAVLAWGLESNPELALILARPAALVETADAGAGPQLNVTRPTRAVPGGLLEVQVQAPGFNFRDQPVAFCFSAARGAVQEPGSARLLSQTGAQALFEVRVPGGNGSSAKAVWHARAGDLWDQIFGVPSQLRVIGYANNLVVLDSSVNFNLANAWTAVLAGLAVLAVLFIVFGLLAGERGRRLKALQSLMLHPSGRYSLSKTQVMLWTVLVLFALVFVWVSTGEILVISAGMLVLLGISGTSSVLARAIEAKPGAAAEPLRENVAPQLKDLVMSEDGEGVDLMRFQMLGFTLFTWGYSLLSVLHSDGLPDIPQHLYVLMGVSNATYLGGKLVGDGTGTPAATIAAAVPDPDLLRRLQQALKLSATGRLDGPTLQAVKDFKALHGLLPADESISLVLVEKAEALR